MPDLMVLRNGNGEVLRRVLVSEEGYLLDSEDWWGPSKATSAALNHVALTIAQKEEIEMTEEHWRIIELVRQQHQRNKQYLRLETVLKIVEKVWGNGKTGRLEFLYKLFPKGENQLMKISGLEKLSCCG